HVCVLHERPSPSSMPCATISRAASTLSPETGGSNVTRITGVLSPVVTPFGADLAPDAQRFARHCRWLLSQNVGLAVFGTNSEANSLSVEEKIELLDGLVAAGLDPARMMPGAGCSPLPDSVRLTAHAMKLGCGGVLMLPPFYYKGVSDDGLFRGFAEVIERVGEARLRGYPCQMRGGAGALHLSQSAGRAGAHHPRPRRAPAEGLSDPDRGHEGQRGRVEQHESVPRCLREVGLRRLRRLGDLPAPEHASRRRRLHQRD